MEITTEQVSFDANQNAWHIELTLSEGDLNSAIRAALYFMDKIEQMPHDYAIDVSPSKER